MMMVWMAVKDVQLTWEAGPLGNLLRPPDDPTVLPFTPLLFNNKPQQPQLYKEMSSISRVEDRR